jgi:hypothetical protein
MSGPVVPASFVVTLWSALNPRDGRVYDGELWTHPHGWDARVFRAGELLTGVVFDTRDGQPIIDKTGTITRGEPSLTDVVATRGVDEATVLRLAASLERGSEHPLGEAIVRRAREQELGFAAVENLIWVGGMRDDGRGRYWHNGRDMRAHWAAWELQHGEPVPANSRLEQQCKQPNCVRHWKLGRPWRKLTIAAIREIAKSPLGPMALARRYGVVHSVICHHRRASRTYRRTDHSRGGV